MIQRIDNEDEYSRKDYLDWLEKQNCNFGIQDIMRTCLDKISKEIVERVVLNNQAMRDIAEALHLHEKTVRYRYNRAIHRIKAIYLARQKMYNC